MKCLKSKHIFKRLSKTYGIYIGSSDYCQTFVKFGKF